jgi:hypothetical protein
VSAAFTVVVDLALARRFRITLQELPSLCSRLLESGGDDQPAGTLFLTDAHLTVQAQVNTLAASEDQAKRALRSRRSALTLAARTANHSPAPNRDGGLLGSFAGQVTS